MGWNDLSISEKRDVMKVAIQNGITNLGDIKQAYNEFADSGNLYAGTERHSQQLNQGYIHDVLPRLLRDAGLNIKVTSGYRPVGAAGNAGKNSWHPRHGAVDIVPVGNTTFDDIENALYTNPTLYNYMLANNLGILDETGRTEASRNTMRKTGATGEHLHLGKDTIPAREFAQRMSNRMSQAQPSQWDYLANFTPTNPQAFYGTPAYSEPIIVGPIEQTALEESPYTKERLELEERRRGFNNLMTVLGMMNPSDSNDLLGTLGVIGQYGNQSAYGGPLVDMANNDI